MGSHMMTRTSILGQTAHVAGSWLRLHCPVADAGYGARQIEGRMQGSAWSKGARTWRRGRMIRWASGGRAARGQKRSAGRPQSDRRERVF